MRCCKHLSCGPRGPPGPAGQVGPAIAFLVQGTQQFEGGLVFHQLLYDTVLTNVGDRFSLETSTFNPYEEAQKFIDFLIAELKNRCASMGENLSISAFAC